MTKENIKKSNLLLKLLDLYISGSALMITIFTYMPFYYGASLFDWKEGIDAKKLPPLKGAYHIIKSVHYGIIYPKLDFIKRMSYIFILPLLKSGAVSEDGEHNPAGKMFTHYYESIEDNRNVSLTVHLLDALHKKYAVFLTLVGIIAISFYGYLSLVFLEIAVHNWSMGIIAGISGGILYWEWGGFTVASMFPMFFAVMKGLTITYLSFHFTMVTIVLAYNVFKEIRTMSGLSGFAKENAKMIFLSLKEIYKDDKSSLEKIDKSLEYLMESCKTPKNLNDEFLKLEDKFFQDKETEIKAISKQEPK